MENYIEDYLHILIDTIGVSEVDHSIMTSISRQVKKGIALTDRQYDLVKNKLANYKEQFLEHNIVLDHNPSTRLPLRQIDRRKHVSIVSHSEMLGPDSVYESHKDKWQWIKVRFPFSKKDIVKVESIVNRISQRNSYSKKQYFHKKGSHEHFFFLNEINAFLVYDELKNRSFEIDPFIIETAIKVEDILKNKSAYFPHVSSDGLVNLPANLVESVINEIGQYNNESQSLYKDRSVKYGYSFDTYVNNGTLLDNVASREHPDVLINPEKHNINKVAELIYKLDRFPLVVLIDNDNAADQLLTIHQAFKYIVADNEQSVLFRSDSNDNENVYVNQYVKDNNLNNWVDKDTKIVYIKKNKLPKVLLSSNFKPSAALGKTSMRSNSQVDTYISFNCDLIIYHDNQQNMFGRYSRKYGLL
jgi:hypothetical protein